MSGNGGAPGGVAEKFSHNPESHRAAGRFLLGRYFVEMLRQPGRPGGGEPLMESVKRMVTLDVLDFSDQDAEDLPAAITSVMPSLRNDTSPGGERWEPGWSNWMLRSATQVLAELDLYEAAADLADMAVSWGDKTLLLQAAYLAGNPAAGPGVSGRIRELAKGTPFETKANIRLSPETAASTNGDIILQKCCWPEQHVTDRTDWPSPQVVIDCSLPPAKVLLISTDTRLAGGCPRRLNMQQHPGVWPKWFGARTSLIATPSVADAFRRNHRGGLPPDRVIVYDPNTGDNGSVNHLAAVAVSAAAGGPHPASADTGPA